MQTGLQEALPEEASLIDFDLTAADAVEESDESTAEMKRGPGLEHITNAMGKRDTGIRPAPMPIEDTAEQPALDRSMIVRGLSDASREIEAISVELGEELGADMGIESEPAQPTLTETVRRQPAKGGPGDQTMTEVGTKLDLARAYLDMGDPDGARSILNEVLEEGDQPQRQEARQLLDGMNQ
jgi:pilus assembly protein FimV